MNLSHDLVRNSNDLQLRDTNEKNESVAQNRHFSKDTENDGNINVTPKATEEARNTGTSNLLILETVEDVKVDDHNLNLGPQQLQNSQTSSHQMEFELTLENSADA